MFHARTNPGRLVSPRELNRIAGFANSSDESDMTETERPDDTGRTVYFEEEKKGGSHRVVPKTAE